MAIQDLLKKYHNYNRCTPCRVVVYRDGGSDGYFDDIVDMEIKGIRQALYEWNQRHLADFECKNELKCNEQGCEHCTQPITFLVAQNNHGTKIVPDPIANKGIVNVYSGTVMDSKITSYRNGMKLATENVVRIEGRTFATATSRGFSGFGGKKNDEGGYDFYLTPQAGRMGTPRSVNYRVLLNENSINKPIMLQKQSQQQRHAATTMATELTKAELENLTYSMPFLYGPAACAPRKIPVLRYSEKLARITNDSCKCSKVCFRNCFCQCFRPSNGNGWCVLTNLLLCRFDASLLPNQTNYR